MVLVEPVDDGRHKARDVRRSAADPYLACGRVAEEFDVLDTLPQLVEGGMAAAKNGAPAFGELNTVPGALQQTHTKGAFKLADRARKHPAQNVCFRKGIGQEVAWAKFQAMLQSM